MMKNIVNTVWISLALAVSMASCEIFRIDNYEAPNASFHGGIKDAETGELVETDIQNGSAIRAYELGWPSESAQTWYIMQSGEFRNDMVFAAHYKIEFINGNFYPFTVDDLEIKKGDNPHDFQVTPYIRVKDVSIRKEGNQVVASFSLQAGKPEVKLSAVRLYAFTDIYVGEQVKFDTRGDNFRRAFSPAKEIDGGDTYTLRIDLEENADFFQYSRNYYFRVGALADVSGVGTVRYNYAPFTVIPL
ncbi:MAG: DUF3823 domain-containing protein [Tannerellaceae bacterium]|jgi:hypothetical protein|nr:DUF3823 domain-containing protein [Tannerellaceae bacterium]